MNFSVSSPGKVILTGEHAVIFGERAVAASVDLRTTLTITYFTEPRSHLELELPCIGIFEEYCKSELLILKNDLYQFKPTGLPCRINDKQFVGIERFLGLQNHDEVTTRDLAKIAFLHIFLSLLPLDKVVPNISISVDSLIPTGVGLGSSAAFSACVAAAFLRVFQWISSVSTESTRQLINKWAFTAEQVIHGSPSGIDNAVSVFGGVIGFEKKTITPIQAELNSYRILLINTKVKRSTKKMLEVVRRRKDLYPGVIEATISAIGKLTTEMEVLLTGDSELTPHSTRSQLTVEQILAELVCMNQALLCALGVSHEALDDVLSTAALHGMSGKLTGAGGGGCAFVIIPSNVKSERVTELIEILESKGYEAYQTKIGVHGVSVEKDTLPHCLHRTFFLHTAGFGLDSKKKRDVSFHYPAPAPLPHLPTRHLSEGLKREPSYHHHRHHSCCRSMSLPSTRRRYSENDMLVDQAATQPETGENSELKLLRPSVADSNEVGGNAGSQKCPTTRRRIGSSSEDVILSHLLHASFPVPR